jgi:hypothetical protein
LSDVNATAGAASPDNASVLRLIQASKAATRGRTLFGVAKERRALQPAVPKPHNSP